SEKSSMRLLLEALAPPLVLGADGAGAGNITDDEAQQGDHGNVDGALGGHRPDVEHAAVLGSLMAESRSLNALRNGRRRGLLLAEGLAASGPELREAAVDLLLAAPREQDERHRDHPEGRVGLHEQHLAGRDAAASLRRPEGLGAVLGLS